MSFNPRYLLAFVAAGVAALTFPATRLAAQADSVASARRIADIATIAVSEYGLGMVDGRVVSPEELDEARMFLSQAAVENRFLPPQAAGRVRPWLDSLSALVRAHAGLDAMQSTLAALRGALEAGAGVPLDPLPPEPPSLVVGQTVFARECAGCHGVTGKGDGPDARTLEGPPPADLTAPDLAGQAPVDFFRKINVGVGGTAMPEFAADLSLHERWSVALYASLLRLGSADLDAGAEALGRVCPDCRLLVSDFDTTAFVSDRALAALVAAGSGRESASVSRTVLAYARAAGAVEELGGIPAVAVGRTVRRARAVVREASGVAARGDLAAAARRALDAYLVFERAEAAVRARDAAVAGRVERAFSAYRAALMSGVTPSRRAQLERQVMGALEAAAQTMSAEASVPVLFGQSFIIMVREGLEAILIIGALSAVLAKAAAPDRKREIGWGALAAVGASVVTAAAFATVFRTAARHQEALEGVTMLLAAAVLFFVSYWLVSKIELRKWMAFVQDQIGKALSSRRVWALAAVAFLAVYREGFETVLFYAALFTTAAGAAGAVGAVAAGMVAGALVLGVVYYLMQRFGVRLPLKPFFAVTSAFLYVMAFSFAGQGVAELQGAGLVPVTPLAWLPSLPFLGIFPTLQTFVSQIVIAAALVGAVVWVFWIEPRSAGAAA